MNWKTVVSLTALVAALIPWGIYLGEFEWSLWLYLWWTVFALFNYTFGYLTAIGEAIAVALVYAVLVLTGSELIGFFFLGLLVIYVIPAWIASLVGLTVRKALDF